MPRPATPLTSLLRSRKPSPLSLGKATRLLAPTLAIQAGQLVTCTRTYLAVARSTGMAAGSAGAAA
eukprot:15730-Heterococcus_DN1.PRE.2